MDLEAAMTEDALCDGCFVSAAAVQSVLLFFSHLLIRDQWAAH